MAATRTSVGAGNWGDADTWDTGVPADGDTAVIKHAVIFNVDQSAFATGVTVTIWKGGSLTASLTAGAYYLKCGGNISGSTSGTGATAQLLAGTVGTAYPATCTFTIDLFGNHYIDLTSLTCLLYCTQPAHASVKLTAGVSIGATILPVDTDVSADGPWLVASAPVNVDNVNKARDSESRVISTISSTQITLTAGLTNAKIVGTWVHLTRRNVRVIGCTTTTGAFTNGLPSGGVLVLQCEVTLGTGGRAANSVSGAAVFSGVFVGSTQVIINACLDVVLSGVFTGTSNAFMTYCTNAVFSGVCTGCAYGVADSDIGIDIAGTIEGCTYGLNKVVSGHVRGTIRGCTYACAGGNLIFEPGAVLNNNAQDISMSGGGLLIGYGVTLGSTIQVGGYAILEQSSQSRVVIWDIGGVLDALKAWMYGGRIISDTGTLPPGSAITTTYNHLFERSGGPVYLDYPIRLRAGANTVTVYCRKDTNSMTETPRAQIVLPGSDPFFGGTAAAEVPMTDNTNWQTLTLFYSSERAQQAVVRVRGAHASGNLWQAIVVAGGLMLGGSMTGGMRG